MTKDDINELQTRGLWPMDEEKDPREFMHAHPDGDLERHDGVKCFHVIEKPREYAINWNGIGDVHVRDMRDGIPIEYWELHVIERRAYDKLLSEKNYLEKNYADVKEEWKILIKQRADLQTDHLALKSKLDTKDLELDQLRLENERLSKLVTERSELIFKHEDTITELQIERNKQTELLTHLEQALEMITNEYSHYVGSLERGSLQTKHPFHGVFEAIARTAQQALKKVKEFKG